MTLLIWTRRDDVTADFVILRLEELGRPFIRLNGDDLPGELRITLGGEKSLSGVLKTRRKEVRWESIDTVWFRRRGVPEVGHLPPQERAFVRDECAEMLDWITKSLEARWVDRPSDVERAEGKLHQHLHATRYGFPSPPMLITNSAKAARSFVEEHGPCVAKALRHKVVESETQLSIIPTRRVDLAELEDAAAIESAPTILQAFVRKKFDVRVTVIGSHLFGTRIDASHVPGAEVDWRMADVAAIRHVPLEVPKPVREFCYHMLSVWNLQFGAFDFVVDNNDEWNFLELNPVGQWAWIEAITGQPLREAMVRLLTRND